MSGVEVRIDADSCAASAMCAYLAPEIFDVPNDADTAIVKTPTIEDPGLAARAEAAARACPTAAISVRPHQERAAPDGS